MGCVSGRDADDIAIQSNEHMLQIFLCTTSQIKSGFFYLEKGEYISRELITMGFENMQNVLSSNLSKQEAYIKPFKEKDTENYLFKDLLIALFVNSRSSVVEKASSIAQLLFKDKDELNQAELIYLFKKLFTSVLSYSFSFIDKYGEQQKNFNKPKTKEEEEKTVEDEYTLQLAMGEIVGKNIGEAMIEQDKTITVEEFAQKCKTFIPDQYYRDIFLPKALREQVQRELYFLGQCDKQADEKIKKGKQEKEEKQKLIKKAKEEKKQEEKEKLEKEEKEKKEKEEQEKKEKESKEKKDKEDKEKK